MFGAQLPVVKCCGVCLSKYNIVSEHNRVDKIRVDATWQHVHVQTFCMWDHGSEVDLLLHTKSLCVLYNCLMIEHTKNPKEQVEHCLISARKIV